MGAVLSSEVLSVFSAAKAVPGTPAWIFADRTWTFGELGSRVTNAAAWLREQGVVPGDRIAFRARSTPAAMLALFAVPAASGTAVPLHPRFTAAEQKAAIDTIAPCRLLDDRELAAMLRASSATRGLASPRLPPRSSGHPWAVLFTSGTSGKPKGIALPARALVASAHASAEVLPFARRERWLLALTPAHVGGLSILTRSLLARKTVVVLEKFDAADMLQAIAKHAVTRISVVPAMLDALLAEDRANRMRRLGAVIVGGAACPRALLERCASRGIRARTTYGMTETCSQVTLQRHDATTRIAGDAGEPLPGVEVQIVPDGRGEPGEGRILVRGPILGTACIGMHSGIRRNASEGAGKPAKARRRSAQEAVPTPAPDEDGWLDTGDRGRLLPDGRLVVLGRGADMIVTGGENVAPAEVERALEACAGVRQALVFGVPDRRYGQVVAAALVADRADGAIDVHHVAARLADQLASFKRPRRVVVVEAIPRTPGGKPDRAGAAKNLAKELRPWE